MESRTEGGLAAHEVHRSFHHAQDRLKVIFLGTALTPLKTTQLTAVKQNMLRRLCLNRDRLHQPATGGGAITGVNVNMPTPKAARAMIGKAIALHLGRTVGTDEIFDGTAKSWRLIGQWCAR